MSIRDILAWSVTTTLLWLITLPIAAFVLLRLFGVADNHAPLFALETLTFVLLAPAYPVLLAALLSQRRVLAITSGLVVILHLVWTAPDLRWWPHHQPPAAGQSFTLVSANVRFSNGLDLPAARTLGRPRADVLVVLELTPPFVKALEESGTVDELPNRVVLPQRPGQSFGAAIYSRFPLDPGPDDLRSGGHPLVSATVQAPGGDVRVVAVHNLQPLAGLTTLRTQLRELGKLAEDTIGPLVLAGDFNATRQHAPFRALLSHGLRDAHMERGRGFARSWPMDMLGPPFALLDHVLVSDEVAVASVRELTVPGSDHRAIVSNLAIAKIG